MTNPNNGIHALLISIGIIDNKPYSEKERIADKKRNKDRPKYGSN